MVRTDNSVAAPHIEIPTSAEGARLTPPAVASPGGTASSYSPSSVSSTFGSARSDSTALSSPATTPPACGSSGQHDGGSVPYAGRKDSGGVASQGQAAVYTDPSVSLRRGRSVKYIPDAFPGYADKIDRIPDSPSSVSSKDEETPRAERSQPVWPLSQIQSETGAGTAKTKNDEGAADADTASSVSATDFEPTIPSRVGSLRRRYATPEKTDPMAADLAGAVSKLMELKPAVPSPTSDDPTPMASRSQPPAWPSSRRKQASVSSDPLGATPTSPTASSSSATTGAFVLPEIRHRIVAESSMTGCLISSPVSPPHGYPLGSSRSSSMQSDAGSAPMSASSSASSASSFPSSTAPSCGPAPLWAQPPIRTNRLAGRALSAGAASAERPVLDFDEELIRGGETDQVMEVIKATDGRIAVQSMPEQYMIRVWLPGFNIDNITLSSRRGQIIQIVADRWEIDDHAQWSVRLGVDANMREISAKFSGSELAITVTRVKSKVGAASASVRSAPREGYI